uniref:DUF1645 domain-containing protein n=1 Tax=Leersia perrieri TaxID=77586 RepID=A0A0D9V3D1_9ORYZ
MEERHRVRVPTVEEERGDAAACSGDEESDGEFEFPFVSRETEYAGGVADELFADGRIRAFYPVFGRVFDDVAPATAAAAERRPPLGRLFLEEGRNSSVGSTSSSSTEAELDGVSPDSYCVWVPGSSPASSPSRPPPPRKSGSTGSIARWRRISELVIGRSHSDGKEKFRFLSAPPSPAREHSKAKAPTAKGAGKFPTELDTIAVGRRMSYSSSPTRAPAGATRRTFLPYRQDLMGLFANVNGLSRTHHRPF